MEQHAGTHAGVWRRRWLLESLGLAHICSGQAPGRVQAPQVRPLLHSWLYSTGLHCNWLHLKTIDHYLAPMCLANSTIHTMLVHMSTTMHVHHSCYCCRQPITAVEWSPREGSVLCTSSSDGTVGVWDLSVERDAEEEAALGASGRQVLKHGMCQSTSLTRTVCLKLIHIRMIAVLWQVSTTEQHHVASTTSKSKQMHVKH